MKTDYRKRYQDYLKSDHWSRLRVESSNLWGDGCYVCQKHPVDFHHLTYRDLISCTSDDVIPLCRNCHQGTHFKPGKIFRALLSAKSNDDKRGIIKIGMQAFIGDRCTEAERDLAAYKKRVSEGIRVAMEAIRKEKIERSKVGVKPATFVNFGKKSGQHKNRIAKIERRIRLKKQREEFNALNHMVDDDIVTVSVYKDGVLCKSSVPWAAPKR